MRTRSLRESTVIFRRDQQSRRWGEGFFRVLRLRSHANTRGWFAWGNVSLFELLLGCPALSRRKNKKLLQSRHNPQDSPGSYTQNKTLGMGIEQPRKMLPYRHAWKSIVRAHKDTNKHREKESIILITSSLAEVFTKASNRQGLSENNKKISVCYNLENKKPLQNSYLVSTD